MKTIRISTTQDLFARIDDEEQRFQPAQQSGCVLAKPQRYDQRACSPVLPKFAALTPITQLPKANRSLIKHFGNWLHLCGFGPAGRLLFGHTLHVVFSLLGKDWREVNPADDLNSVDEYLQAHCADETMCHYLRKGLGYVRAYLPVRQQRCQLPKGMQLRCHWPSVSPPPEPDLVALMSDDDITPTDQSGCVPKKTLNGRRTFTRSQGIRDALGLRQRTLQWPRPPAMRPVRSWPESNQALYQHFRNWLHWSGYSTSAIYLYGLAVRLAFSLVGKDWRNWDAEADVQTVRAYVQAQYESDCTRNAYLKGLEKFEQYLRLRQQRQKLPKAVTPPSQPLHTRPTRHKPMPALPDALTLSINAFIAHAQRNWPREQVAKLSRDAYRRISQPLRWLMACGHAVQQPEDISPDVWFGFVDGRLAQDVAPTTINGNLSSLMGWLHWRAEQGLPVDARMFAIKPLKEPSRMPKDVPPLDLKKLQDAIYLESVSLHPPTRRRGIMDLAWFLLMLHSGLRSGEIRRLQLGDMDWQRRLIRIEQSKGLKDRLAPMSAQAADALNNWLTLRERE
ncbi:MAG: tyrosine-type recombinase/integrase, partial [Brachymonas sp.]|nr:tyrosine-type recombinase/integrase [Brachymonas sp.]